MKQFGYFVFLVLFIGFIRHWVYLFSFNYAPSYISYIIYTYEVKLYLFERNRCIGF